MTTRGRALSVLAALAVAGCASDKYFILVAVEPTTGQIDNVAQLLVDVRMDVRTDRLTFPKGVAVPFALEKGKPVTFSVGFDRTGLVEIGVQPVDANGAPLGYGRASTTLAGSGGTVKMSLAVDTAVKRPDPPDGGVDGDGRDARATDIVDAFACDPVGRTCMANQTCGVACRGDAAVTVCSPAGGAKAGEICTTAGGCAPGTQCFPTGCGTISTCLQFCRTDIDCGAGSHCTAAVTVPCGTMMTNLKLCSRPCDPTGTAETGCAKGLHCFLFGNEVTDCECRGARRTGGDGTACTRGDDCAPGLLCIPDRVGTTTCRPLCRLTAPDTCGAGRTCTAYGGFRTYGACLPR